MSVVAPMPTAPPIRIRTTFSVSVILPTYNEAENIVPLIEALWPQLPADSEIIVVDDNSPDGTANLAIAWAARHPNCRLLVERRLQDRGLTRSLTHGIQLASGDVVVWMDCDFSMPTQLIPQLLRCLEHGFDIAVGSRFVRGGRFKEKTEGTPDSALAVFLSRLMNYSIQFLLDHSFKDYTSGFIAVRREVLETIPLKGNYGEYFIDLIFHALRRSFRIIEVPYVCLPRERGVSKTGQHLWQYIRLGVRYVGAAFRLRLEAALRGPQPRPDLKPLKTDHASGPADHSQ
jgi:dolichol-phosphate mannosyltransferase